MHGQLAAEHMGIRQASIRYLRYKHNEEQISRWSPGHGGGKTVPVSDRVDCMPGLGTTERQKPAAVLLAIQIP